MALAMALDGPRRWPWTQGPALDVAALDGPRRPWTLNAKRAAVCGPGREREEEGFSEE